MTPKDWTLLVIARANGAIQPVQLQKTLFVLGKKVDRQALRVPAFYDFVPYDYGPFCSVIYQDAESLEREGLISISRPPDARFKSYSATEAGLARARQLAAEVAPPTSDYLQNLVKFIQSLNFNELVSAIYKAFPDTKANSVFKPL